MAPVEVRLSNRYFLGHSTTHPGGDAIRMTDDTARKRVLLVDDEPAIRRLIMTTLGSADFDLTAAECGLDALRRAPEVRPDLVLLDVTMPDLDGFAVAERLRAN